MATLNVSAKETLSQDYLEGKNVKTENILDYNRQQTNYFFTWDDLVLRSVGASALSIREAESLAFEGAVSFLQHQVSGTVTDSTTGELLSGVTVRVRGGDVGTVTDAEGRFNLEVEEGAVLDFSFLGYQSRSILVKKQTQINLKLQQDNTQLQDVVVTAFGTQKKLTLTGAVSTVSGSDVIKEPVANVTSALVGQVPGVNGLQATGEPGHNTADIKIRGVATYGNSTPLVVIDGVEQPAEEAFVQLNAMDPNEVDNISILKDASATAVYGIRAANGVIIVTTKRGRTGEAKVSLSANYGISMPTKMAHGLDSYRWAKMRNEAINMELKGDESQGGLASGLFSDDDLWKLQHNLDYTYEEMEAMGLNDEQIARLESTPAIYYGSFDVYDQMFGSTGPQTQLNLHVSGGSEKVKYFTSIGFLDQESFAREMKYYSMSTRSGYQRYNLKTNLDIDVIDNLTISVNLAAQFGKMNGPGGGGNDPYNLSSRYQDMMHLVIEGNPIESFPILENHLIAGLRGSRGSDENPLGGIIASEKGSQNNVYFLLSSGYKTLYNNLLDNTVRFDYKMPYLLEGLSITGTANFQDNYSKLTSLHPSFPVYSVARDREDPSKLAFYGGGFGADNFDNRSYSTWNKVYVDLGINYAQSFDKHNVSGLILGKASKYTMPGDNFNTPSGIMGLVERMVYDYDNRYLAEVNMGYNGTEQFRKGHRFSLFPAFSLGWIPTLEAFYPENNFLTFFKIRGSYGVVGNDLLGGTGRRYLYLPNTYDLGSSGYYLGTADGTTANSHYPGASEGDLGNPNITWEKAKKLDIGLESIFFQDRLTINFDWFSEKRDNILTTLGTIPDTYGVDGDALPPANVGRTQNKGYELLIRWDDRVGSFSYGIEGHVTHAKNKILYRAESLHPYDWMNETGKSIGQRFGLQSDGLYNNIKELNNRPFNNFTGNTAMLGDIKYLDLNGDGVINDEDRAPIGYPNLPEYSFGIKLNLQYKGLALSALFNGSRHGSYYLNAGYIETYAQHAGNAYTWQWDKRWTPEKADAGIESEFPRVLYGAPSSHNNFIESDFWIVPNDFLRLKNLMISYSFPADKGFINRLGLGGLRIYLSGYNVFTFKNKLQSFGIDPESNLPGKYQYPLIRTFNFGFNIEF